MEDALMQYQHTMDRFRATGLLAISWADSPPPGDDIDIQTKYATLAAYMRMDVNSVDYIVQTLNIRNEMLDKMYERAKAAIANRAGGDEH